MFRSHVIKAGAFLPILLISFSLLANTQLRMSLAEDYTTLMYPAEFYGIHGPLVNELLDTIDVDSLKLPQNEKNDLKNKLEKMFLTKSIKSLIESRAEVYTENDLNDLLTHYQSKIGKQIIHKAHQSQYKPPIFNQEELTFMNVFAKKHANLSEKSNKITTLYRKKFAEQSFEIGGEVALMVASHLDAYEKRSK